MLKSFIFTSVFGDKMTVSAYHISDAEKQAIQMMRVCDFKGDFTKANNYFKMGKLVEVTNVWENYYGR